MANHTSYSDALVIAALLAEPVIPIALKGTRRKLPSDRWNPRAGPVEAVVAKPIMPDGEDWGSAIKLRDGTRRRLLELTGEPDLLGERQA